MGRPRKKYKTFHLSVPEEDTEIAEWMSMQFSQSASVRELIRDAICDIGMCDLFTGRAFDRKPGQSGRAAGSLASYEKERAKRREEAQVQMQEQPISSADSEPMTSAAPPRQKPETKRNTGGGRGISIDRDILAGLHPEKKTPAGDEDGREALKPASTKPKATIDDIMSMLDG